MKKSTIFFLFILTLFLFAGCSEMGVDEDDQKDSIKIPVDTERYREEYLEREDQQGYVPYDSKYGYDIPEITKYHDGFVDYLGSSVTFTAQFEDANRDFLDDGEGGVFVFRTIRTQSGENTYRNMYDGIVYYDPEGNPSRVCIDPECAVDKTCTHGMELNGSFVEYWEGNLYFIGYREEAEERKETVGIQETPLRSYVIRYDIETRTFRKLIEFFDRTAYMLVIRDGVLFLVSGDEREEGKLLPTKYLSSVDLRTGEASRICIGESDVYGICEGKLVLQSPEYGKGWNEAEYKVELMDPEDGSRRTIGIYTAAFCGAAGKYVLYLGRWETGLSYDLFRRDPNAETPEVLGRNVVKFRTRGERCVWLCSDGGLWRSDVTAYEPHKIASKVADFKIQNDGRIVYFQQNSLRKVKTSGFGVDTLGDGSLWVTTGLSQREKIWEASGSTRWLGTCAVGKSVAFVTAMYYEILYQDMRYQYRETRIIKKELNGDPPEILYRRIYNMSDEEWRSHQSFVHEQYVERRGYWFVDYWFWYYPQRPE